MSKERSAREVVEGITNGFETVDSNHVREALETHDSPADVLAALGEFGEFQEQVIDPEIVIDFSAFQSALTPDAPETFHGWDGWMEMWRLWLGAWEDYEPLAALEMGLP
jgi:hypothetical protein